MAIANNNLFKFQSEEIVEEMEAAQSAQVFLMEQPKKEIITFIERRWQAARFNRSEITARINEARHIREKRYTSDKLADIERTGQSDIFIGLIDHKCNLATAWMRDLYFGQTDKPWSFSPTPVPTVPEEFEPGVEEMVQESFQAYTQQTGFEPDDAVREQIREEVNQAVLEQIQELAKTKTKLQEKEIEDLVVESDYYSTLNDLLDDIVTYPNCMMEFVLVKERELSWSKDAFGETISVVKPKIKIKFVRIDPNSIFPAKGCTNVNDRYICLITRMDADEIRDLRGTPGSSEEDIDALFEKYPEGSHLAEGYYSTPDKENEYSHPDNTYDVIRYFGKIHGKVLQEWDSKGEYDENEDYEVKAYYVCDQVIKVIINHHPLGKRGLFSTSYKTVAGQFWGESLVDLLKPMGDMCNAAGRALVGNMGIASGPQVIVNTDLLAPGEKLTSLYPWKIWKVKSNYAGSISQPISFDQPDPIITGLIAVYEFFSNLADDFSGFPKFLVGSEQPTGAGRTATGLSLLMSNASKFMKQVVLNIDRNIIESSISYLHVHFMVYSTKNYAKGDIRIHARGVTHMSMQESVTLRRNEFLQVTNNPTDLQIMGLKGRMNLLKEVIPALDIDVSKVITPEMEQRIESLMRQQGQQPQQQEQQPQQIGSEEQLQNGQPVADNFSPSQLL